MNRLPAILPALLALGIGRPAAAASPAWGRAWDADARRVYLQAPDSDGDGLSDAEERTGLALWGVVESNALAWVEANGAPPLAEWAWMGVDDDVQPVSLPFAFPWGGRSWSRVWVGVNGTLGFDRGHPSPTPQALPSPEYVAHPLLAVAWTQLYLDPGAGGRVWSRSPGPNRFVICWENLRVGDASDSRVTVQAELRANGDLVWRHRALDGGPAGMPAATVGVQSGANGWTFAHADPALLRTNQALRLVACPGTNPLLADSDGDGTADGIEFYYTWERPGGLRLDAAAANATDPDRDGLTSTQEYLSRRTDALGWDSDGDMLADGYESDVHLDPLDAAWADNLEGDPDNDGLPNRLERRHGTNPLLADSDGDGTNDGTEVALGTNPLGSGGAPAPNWLAPVRFTLGDPGQDGATEAYRLLVEPLSGDTRAFVLENTAYGTLQAQSLPLCVGGRYRLRVDHLGTDPSVGWPPDADFVLAAEAVKGTVMQVDDPQGLLAWHASSTPPAAPGDPPVDTSRSATLWVQARAPGDGTPPVADPSLTPRLDAWHAARATGAAALPTAEKVSPGCLALPAYNPALGGLLPAKVRARGLGSSVNGATRWLRFSDRSRVTLWRSAWAAPIVPPADEVAIDGPLSGDVDFELRPTGTWSFGTSVTVSHVVRLASGTEIGADPVRLIGQVVLAFGDSMTYGFRRRRDGTYEMPLWRSPWTSYPDPSSWNSYPGNWWDIAYQGSRGYLQQDLTTAVPWTGDYAKGHGPDHMGYPGARTTDLNIMLADTSRTYPRAAFLSGPNCAVVVYFIGLNDVIGDRSASTVYDFWKQGLAAFLAQREGRGRTVVVGVTLPRMRSDYSGYTSSRQNQLIAFNGKVRSHTISTPYVRYVVADAEYVPHDSNDDGLHFLAPGYQKVEQIVRQAILARLQAGL